MQDSDEHDDIARLRRSYRMMFAASISLAAIGAPLLMQGAVALAASFSDTATARGGSVVQGVVLFALSGIPMTLAWFAWQRTQEFQQSLDREP